MAGSSGLWAVFSLCNGELEDEGRQGRTHSTCHGTDAPTPLVPQRTAAAPAVRRHYDTSEPARWRAGATPAARHPATTRCRLKVFSQATTRGPLRRHGVGSRFPLKMGPGADGYGSGRMSVAFSLAWLKPPFELLQTGVDLHRKAQGPYSSTNVEPVNDRPSPRSVLVQTSTRHSAAPGCQAGFSTSRRGFCRQLATAGPLVRIDGLRGGVNWAFFNF